MARKPNFVILVDQTLTIDGERLARKLKTVTAKTGVLREWRHHSEFMPRSARARKKAARARKFFLRTHAHDGEPKWRLAADARRHPQDA